MEHLVHNAGVRYTMGEAGLIEAAPHSWSEAMEKLVDGYEEGIVGTRPFVAA